LAQFGLATRGPLVRCGRVSAVAGGKSVRINASVNASRMSVVHQVFGGLGLWGRALSRFAAHHPAYYRHVARQIGDSAADEQRIVRAAGGRTIAIIYSFDAAHWAWLKVEIEQFRTGRPPRPNPHPKPNLGGGGVVPTRSRGGRGVPGDGTIPRRSQPPPVDVFRRVYQQAQSLLETLIGDLDRVLLEMGATNDDAGRAKFGRRFREVLVRIYAKQLTLAVRGAADSREAVVVSIVLGLGGDQFLGKEIHHRASRMTAEQIRTDNGPAKFPNVPFFSWIHTLHSRAVAMRSRLQTLRGRIKKGYDRVAGVDQACTLLSWFPDVAQPIYVGAGLKGLTSFPPRRVGPLNPDAERFEQAALAWKASEDRWGMVVMGGIIVAGIALSVVSAGTMTPLMATIVSAGFGLGLGAANIYGTQNELRFQMDARAFNAGSDGRVEYAEGEADAAQWAFVVDLVTMGLLARFGGAGRVSLVRQTFRVAAISGAGGALVTATNPNVWKSPDVAALIIVGTLVGAGLGAGGVVVGNGVARTMQGAARVALFRDNAPLAAGKTVMVTLPGRSSPVKGVVIKISGDELWVRVGGEVKTIKVTGVSTLEGNARAKDSAGSGKPPKSGRPSEGDVRLRMPAGQALARIRRMALPELYSTAKAHLQTINRWGKIEHQNEMMKIARDHLTRGGTLETLPAKSRDLVMHEALEGLLYSKALNNYHDAHMTAMRLLGHSQYNLSHVPADSTVWKTTNYEGKTIFKIGPAGRAPDKDAVEIPRPQ